MDEKKHGFGGLGEPLTQDVVGFAQYDALRVEYEDRKEQTAIAHREEINQQRKELLENATKSIERWKKMCITLAAVLGIFIVGILGFVFYVATSFDFIEYEYIQDGEEFNYINNGEQGDVVNGSTASDKDNN